LKYWKEKTEDKMAGLEKLTIIAYDNNKYQGSGTGKVEVLINPDKYTHAYRICYSTLEAPGSPGGSPKFNRVPSDHVSFELVFDGTGIIGSKIPGVIPGKTENVAIQIQKFKDVVFKYNPKMHSPNFIQLSWGTLVFNCRLTGLDINYTLFQPDGTPLRAKASATFIGFDSEETLARMAKKKSPDLTHVVKVKAGDTLPLLCFKIYGDASYFIQVAEKNNLTDFRELKPDTDILFPPIKK
jgi:hypothetical protein